jgi:prephenate dehydratase
MGFACKHQDLPYWDGSPSDPSGSAGKIATVGTPGSFLTCSTDVARRAFPDKQILAMPTYEDAAHCVLEGKADSLLVPAAYPRVAIFVMDERFTLASIFSMVIPTLVLVKGNPRLERLKKIYYHPATEPLLGLVDTPFDDAIVTTSNEVAVSRMLKHPRTSGAITNGLVAQHFKLPITQLLRASKPMGWLVFKREEAEEEA